MRKNMRISIFFLVLSCLLSCAWAKSKPSHKSTGAVVKEMIHKQIEKRMPHPEKRGHIAGTGKLAEANDAIKQLVDDELAERVHAAEKYISENLLHSIQNHISEQQTKLLEGSHTAPWHHADHSVEAAAPTPQAAAQVPSTPVCKDSIHDCKDLKNMGVCETSKDAMSTKCPKTCNLCTDSRSHESQPKHAKHTKKHHARKAKVHHDALTSQQKLQDMYNQAAGLEQLENQQVNLGIVPMVNTAAPVETVLAETVAETPAQRHAADEADEQLRAAAAAEEEARARAKEATDARIQEEKRIKKEKKKRKKQAKKAKKAKKKARKLKKKLEKQRELSIQKDLANACNANCKLQCLPSCASIPGCCESDSCPTNCAQNCGPHCRADCCKTPPPMAPQPPPAAAYSPPAPATAPGSPAVKTLHCPAPCPKRCSLNGCTPDCCFSGSLANTDPPEASQPPPVNFVAPAAPRPAAPTDPALEWAAAYGLTAGTCPSGCPGTCAPDCNFECCKASLDPAIIQQMSV